MLQFFSFLSFWSLLWSWVSGKCNSLAVNITNASSIVIPVYAKKSKQKRAWTLVLSSTVKSNYYTGMSEQHMSTYEKLPISTTMYNVHVDAHRNRRYILGNDRRDKSCSTLHHVTFNHAAVQNRLHPASHHTKQFSVQVLKSLGIAKLQHPLVKFTIYYHIFASISKKKEKKKRMV